MTDPVTPIPPQAFTPTSGAPSVPPVVAAQPIAFAELDRAPAPSDTPAIDPAGANPLHGVKAAVRVCVGEAELTVGELMAAKENQVLRLDRRVDEPVDIVLHGQVIARGHLVAVGDQFGVRITELPRLLTP